MPFLCLTYSEMGSKTQNWDKSYKAPSRQKAAQLINNKWYIWPVLKSIFQTKLGFMSLQWFTTSKPRQPMPSKVCLWSVWFHLQKLYCEWNAHEEWLHSLFSSYVQAILGMSHFFHPGRRKRWNHHLHLKQNESLSTLLCGFQVLQELREICSCVISGEPWSGSRRVNL